MQGDIMRLLEEAGAETVGTVLATLKITDQDEFNAQVNGLITLGLVRKEQSNVVLTERGKVALRT
jgi:predicted transcriptional regulator